MRRQGHDGRSHAQAVAEVDDGIWTDRGSNALDIPVPGVLPADQGGHGRTRLIDECEPGHLTGDEDPPIEICASRNCRDNALHRRIQSTSVDLSCVPGFPELTGGIQERGNRNAGDRTYLTIIDDGGLDECAADINGE